MKKMLLKLVLLCLCYLFGGFPFHVYQVLKGNSVTLSSYLSELKNNNLIQWRFSNEDTVLAEINVKANRFSVFDDVLDGRFRDRLKLDNKTGSLTITDIRTEHAGSYVLLKNPIHMTLIYLTVSDEIEIRKAETSVTLSSGVSELKKEDQILWRFGDKETLIAEINKQTNRFSVHDDVLDERFRDSLKLDNKTGSLTITDTRTEHAGVYKVQTNNETNSVKLILLRNRKRVSVKMRNSVTLSSGVSELKNEDRIQWRFGDEDTLMAEINKETNRFSVFDDVPDGRFRDRLKLDKKTGSLTITNTRTEHAGVYKVLTNYIEISFHLIVYDEISVKKGKSVTIYSGLTELKNDQIQWWFGDKDTLIAEINKRADTFSVHDDVLDGRFRDRLKLDNKTGSLTITDTRTEHDGVYKVQTNFTNIAFHLNVCDDISVKEGDSVTLNSGLTELKNDDQIQWKFGNEDTLIAQINNRHNILFVFDDVPDGRFRDRLKLDNKTGSLTITDTRTEHAGVYKVQTNYNSYSFLLAVYDSVHCCGHTEAVIRLVLSALVGVATVIFVLYDIRSTRAEQDVHTSGT